MNKITLFFILILLSNSSFSQRFYLGEKVYHIDNDFKLIGISSKTNDHYYQFIGKTGGDNLYGREIGDIIICINKSTIVTTYYSLIPKSDDIGVPSSVLNLFQKTLTFPLAFNDGIYGVNIDDYSYSISRTSNGLTFNKDRILIMNSVRESKLK